MIWEKISSVGGTILTNYLTIQSLPCLSRLNGMDGKLHLKIEALIELTPRRFRASLFCSREDSIPAFNFSSSILSLGNSFSRLERVVTRHSTIPFVKSFIPISPVNWIIPSRYSNSPANGSRKANSSDFSIRDSLNTL